MSRWSWNFSAKPFWVMVLVYVFYQIGCFVSLVSLQAVLAEKMKTVECKEVAE
jgi:hypothetical protein